MASPSPKRKRRPRVGRPAAERPRKAARPVATPQELDLFFALTLDLLCIADFDGYFKRLNPAWERVLGYSRQELIGRPYIEFVHPDDREATLAEAAKLNAGGTVVTFENRYRCKDGSYKWLLWNSAPLPARQLIFAAARDITGRKQAEAQLQQYADEISDLYNNAPCGYHSLGPDGTILRINDTELRWLGYSREELVGKRKLPELLAPQSLTRFQAEFPRFKERGWVRDIEFDLVRQDGSVLPVLLNATAVRDAGGNYVMSRSTVLDNTERRALERMKDEFIAMTGHELRTPLTALRGALAILAGGRHGVLDEKGTHMLEIAVESTDRLSRLVNDLLDLQRMELGRLQMEKKPCDAARLLRDTLGALQPLAEKAQVKLETAPADLTVQCDAGRIIQALTNLISNAIKFSPPGESVQVRVERRNADAVFSVEDRGRGIPPEHLEGIFERFRQVYDSDAREHGGTGLGLAISRGIVQQHGGRIWADSRPGGGAVLRFTLPLASAAGGEPGGAS